MKHKLKCVNILFQQKITNDFVNVEEQQLNLAHDSFYYVQWSIRLLLKIVV